MDEERCCGLRAEGCQMVRSAVQVRSGAARFSVAVQAESIERALEIAKKQNLGRGCKGTFAVIDRGWGGRILPALDHFSQAVPLGVSVRQSAPESHTLTSTLMRRRTSKVFGPHLYRVNVLRSEAPK